MDAFNRLNMINCSDKIEQKNGLSYLPWAWAWAELKKLYPASFYTIYEGKDGCLYHTDGKTCWVKTGVTLVDGEERLEHVEYLPIMDMRNRSVPVGQVSSTDANKAIQRSLTKACARHGLGLYVYAGEDLPESSAKEQPEEEHGGKLTAEDGWNALADITTFCAANNIKMADFGAMRNAAVAGGIVQDIPSSKLTKEECAALLRAIKANFLPVQPAQ